ncbi:MAG TPA: 23S rRNA (adenine(2503)-C(2))-methyltransferase RlmN [Opitutae bacterium]|nr:23S rRNA (adenine(2503)-C(2))-methyltransferase RlmN [Opitutae bacterium]
MTAFFATENIDDRLAQAGFESFRVKQVLDWAYRKPIFDWKEASNLPQNLKTWLEEHLPLFSMRCEVVSATGKFSEKALFRLADGGAIETVLLKTHKRHTVCVSSQLGCAYGCKFCASGLHGFKRNLEAHEIVEQVLFFSKKLYPKKVDNVVYMGMGEPLANYDNVIQSIRKLTDSKLFAFSPRRITLSTSGIAPAIKKLADEDLPIRLAISLHAPNDTIRSQIMPVNQKYPLATLLEAANYFQSKGRRITLEYILIDSLNDTPILATELAILAKKLSAHVNLIPYNPVKDLPWKRPSLQKQRAFLAILESAVPTSLRIEKGTSIDAACGQLALKQKD